MAEIGEAYSSPSSRGAHPVFLFQGGSAFQLLGENGHTLGASLNTHRNADLQDGHDLFRRRSRIKGSLDVPSNAGCIHVRDRRVEGNADELPKPWCENTALVDVGSKGKELIGPERGELIERFPRRVPLTDGAHGITGWSLRLRTASRLYSGCLHLFKEYRSAQAARMDGESDAIFEDEKDFIARCTGVQRGANLTAGACLVEVGARAVQ